MGKTKGILLTMLNEKDEFKRFETTTLLAGRTQIEATNTFNTSDFEIINNVVDLKNKTSYWSCPGGSFIEELSGDTWNHTNDFQSKLTIITGNGFMYAPVFLPNGAEITACVVYGDDATNTWIFYKKGISTGIATSLANANVDTEDTTILAGSEVVDNSTYSYFIRVMMGVNDSIQGARVTYTTDYI